MTSRRTALISAPLVVVVAIAAGVEGTIVFTGARWVPHTTRDTGPLPTGHVPTWSPPVVKSHNGNSNFPFALVILIIAIVLAVVLLAVALWYLYVLRPRRARFAKPKLDMLAPGSEAAISSAVDDEPAPPELRTGVEIALARLHEAREPADAVIRAWVGLEESAVDSGITRRDAETPTEFTQRVMRRVAPDTAAVTTLLRLYLRTRFGDHPVTQADVASVREALQALVRTWHGPDEPGGVA